MTPNNPGIEKIIDRIFNSGKPRSIFLWEGKLYDCPSDGAIERKYLERPEYLFLGRYDCEVIPKMLVDDIAVAEAEAASCKRTPHGNRLAYSNTPSRRQYQEALA